MNNDCYSLRPDSLTSNNRGQSPSTRLHQRIAFEAIARSSILALVLSIITITAVAQQSIVDPKPKPPGDSLIEAVAPKYPAYLSILYPVEFSKAAAARKTPEQLQQEERARFAVTNPVAYNLQVETPKTLDQLTQKAFEALAITDPQFYSQPVAARKTAEQRQQRDAAVFSILNPAAANVELNKKKTPEHCFHSFSHRLGSSAATRT